MEERTLNIKLNVTLDRADEREPQEIARLIVAAIEVGLDPEETNLHPSQILASAWVKAGGVVLR